MSYYNAGHIEDKRNTGSVLSPNTNYIWRTVANGENHEGVFVAMTQKESGTERARYQVCCGDHTPISGQFSGWVSQHSRVKYKENSVWNNNTPDYPTTTATESNSVIIGGGSWVIRGDGDTPSQWYMVECTVPIFDVSDGDYSKVNKYVTEGDDSGAENYSDLHPTTLTIEVKYDGVSYPNFYVRGIVDGTVSVSSYAMESHYVIEPGAPEELLIDTTLEPSESWKMFTYGEVLADKDGGTIHFSCHDLSDGALLDLDTNVNFSFATGEGVVDIYTPSRNGKVILVVEEGYPQHDDEDGDNTPWTDTNSNNTYSGANKLTDTYLLSPAQLISLGNFFWSSTFKDNIFGLCNYPLENVIAIKAMPVVMSGAEKTIQVGNVNSGINALEVSGADNYKVNIGKVFIPEYFENFIDYASVNLQIYLPFIGYKELDNLVCMNRWLNVSYVFDAIMGTCMAILDVKDKNGVWMQYQCYQGNCGIDISIASTNRASIENGYINAGLDTVSDIMRGDLGGAVKNVFNASTQDFHSQSTGAGNPSLMNRMTNKCYVIVRRPKKFDISDNYGHTYGFPLYKKKLLSSQRGFTVCDNFDVNISRATDTEKEEIKRLMESGVYIKEVE